MNEAYTRTGRFEVQEELPASNPSCARESMYCLLWMAQGQSWSLFCLGRCKYNACSCSKILSLCLCNTGCPPLTTYIPNYEDCNTSCDAMRTGYARFFKAHFVAFEQIAISFLCTVGINKYILEKIKSEILPCYWPSAIWKPESNTQQKVCKLHKKRKHYDLPHRGSFSKELEMPCWSWQSLLLLVPCWC